MYASCSEITRYLPVTQRYVMIHVEDKHADEARRRGFPGLWRVHAPYTVFDDIVAPCAWVGRSPADVLHDEEQNVRFYPPILHPEIVGAIAKLQRGDEAAAVAFANQWGSLGYSVRVPPEKRVGGDPLDWLWDHADAVRQCLKLTEMIQNEDESKIRDELDVKSLSDATPDVIQNGPGWFTDAGSVIDLARHVRRTMISKQIVGVRWELRDVEGRDRAGFRFNALSEVVYLHLADLAVGGQVRRCQAPDCGALFIQTDKRQQFCRPQGDQKEAPCAVRHRVRKSRASKPKCS